MPTFAQRLIDWQINHGRHDLPWQQTTDPYRVWLAEIMLQQTRVGSVIGYYQRFLERFPALDALADAPVEAVMALWSGLGYYARARNLHACARTVMQQHAGRFPRDPQALAQLPGIGRSTANAIAVCCFGARAPILDGNVKRLLCRYLGIEGFPGSGTVSRRLWEEAAALLPERDVARYIQAQMDMGATLCTRHRPRCGECPVAAACVARRAGRVAALPTPRPRMEVPERFVTLLVLHAGDRVLLERRPPAGIWGSLLSLPELPEGTPAAEYAARHLGVAIDAAQFAIQPAPTFSHRFTHFRLHIRPLFCEVATSHDARLAEPGLRWVSKDELANAALPAPVRRLLNEYTAAFPPGRPKGKRPAPTGAIRPGNKHGDP